MRRARELHATKWSQREIEARLAIEGYRPLPSLTTIWEWTHPDQYRAQLDRRNARRRRSTEKSVRTIAETME